MKFFSGLITGILLMMIIFISCWLYFGLPIETNNEVETPTEQVQQDKEYTQVPTQDNDTVIDDAGQEAPAHNEAGTNNYEYAKTHGLIQEEK